MLGSDKFDRDRQMIHIIVSEPKQGIRAVLDFGVNLGLRSCLYSEAVSLEHTNISAECAVWRGCHTFQAAVSGQNCTRLSLGLRVHSQRLHGNPINSHDLVTKSGDRVSATQHLVSCTLCCRLHLRLD